jgi:hypothetical protein
MPRCKAQQAHMLALMAVRLTIWVTKIDSDCKKERLSMHRAPLRLVHITGWASGVYVVRKPAYINSDHC